MRHHDLAAVNCPIGRVAHDPRHPTCASCERQGARTCATKRRASPSRPAPAHLEGRRLVVYRDLRTPNAWTNKERGHLIYRSERRAWERACAALPHVVGMATGRRLLSVNRVVPDRRYLIRDETNRQGAMKPLEDALVRLGVLLDDADQHLEREMFETISHGHCPRVEITIEEAP